MYASDAYFIIPKQFLPFEKWNPAEWYLEVIGARGSGVGYMFGVMAQAVLGLDWLELVLRGGVLALLFAFLHRWYVRNALGFWPTLFYLFVSIWSYYTFRGTTFWFVHFLIYQFLPVLIVAKLIEVILTRSRARIVQAG